MTASRGRASRSWCHFEDKILSFPLTPRLVSSCPLFPAASVSLLSLTSSSGGKLKPSSGLLAVPHHPDLLVMDDDQGITLSMDGQDKVIMITMDQTSGSEISGCDQMSVVPIDLNPCGSSNNNGLSNNSNNKKRPSKPQGPEYEYFTIVSERPNGKGYRLRCNYCDNREMNSHAPRMRKHLVFKCTGNVPESVKDKFRNHKPVYTKNDDKIRKSSRKRTAIHFDSGNTSDDDDDEEDEFEKNRDSHALLAIQSGRKSEETTSGKKPLKQFTDEDFEREHKELQTKKMRLEIKVMEDKSKFWAKMGTGVDKILRAVDMYIESQVRAAQQELPQVHTLYTNQDGSTVLQAAFAETITNGSGDVA